MTSTHSSRRGRAAIALSLAAVLGGTLLGPPAAAEEGADGFSEVLSFEAYQRTALNGQDGWSASSAARVIADPLNGNNQVLEMVGGTQRAHRAVPGIADGTTGTVFFRFMRTGSVDTSFGITDLDAPSDYVHSRAYVNNQNNDVMLVRDGGAFKPAGVWSRDTWQCVWIVADNATDKVSVYSQGGPYEEITRLPEGTEQQFGFRQGVTSALDRFFWINGASSAGRLMLDDVAVDTAGQNLAIPTGNPADCAAGGTTPNEPLLNPLPDPTPSTLGIEVTELAQLPASQTTPATQDPRLVRHNRITHLDEIPDGSGRLMVPDNNAVLYTVDKDTGAYVPYLDVRQRFLDNFHNSAGLGTGLGSAEFHPDFAENGLFYTVHTEGGTALTEDTPDYPAYGNTQFHSVVTEWRATDPSAEVFEGTSREVLRVPFAGRVHTVQQIAFNPTVTEGDADYGNLYVLVGDGGNGVGNGNPQNLGTPQGKVFRIDPLGTNAANGQYGIPADNPFVGTPGALPEIYAVGLRDPHRISWDPEGDHTMYLGHIGEWQVESVYAVEPGDNFGWSVREGSFLADNRQIYPLPANDAENGFTYPVAAYDHNRDPGQTGDAGVALNGGFVYRGDIPELRGRYLFTDLVRGWVLATEQDEMVRNDGDLEDLAEIEHLRVFADGEETTFQELVGDQRVDLRFGSDADGELYLISKANGKIWQVTGARRAGASSPVVLPELAGNVAAHYDFDHPVAGSTTWEADQGWSGTNIQLVNGGVEMRVADRAYPGAGEALQTQQMSPLTASNDDWKAGVYDPAGVDSLGAFAGADEISVMGWFKPTGEHPALNSGTANPDDRYNAIGLAGVLTGTSDGHAVRALLEVITVGNELKLVALGRRVDGAGSWTFAADLPWDQILERNRWVHLTATFDFAGGEMKLYMNGEELEGRYTASNPWGAGATSPTDPAGLKIGGSYPQDTREANPFHGRMDDLMFLDVVPTPEQVAAQYARFGRAGGGADHGRPGGRALGAADAGQVAVPRRRGRPRPGGRQPERRHPPPVRVRRPHRGSRARLVRARRRGQARRPGVGEQPGRDRGVRLAVGHGVLLRPPVAGQHDLRPQRHLQGGRQGPGADRRPVGRRGRRPAGGHGRGVARRARRALRGQRRHRRVPRRARHPAPHGERHDVHRGARRLRLVRQHREPARPRRHAGRRAGRGRARRDGLPAVPRGQGVPRRRGDERVRRPGGRDAHDGVRVADGRGRPARQGRLPVVRDACDDGRRRRGDGLRDRDGRRRGGDERGRGRARRAHVRVTSRA
ncbi:hypothetical protein M768_15730 [Cellulosimicrobium cellulans F16]|uniref:LamG-like jellyroll fold domain-containing protein n=1 Tax=Cellulosimicrobium cellulans F16 TaxID=1350482 RepID=A0A0M0F4B9_CELCE|nr:PQQ-dependent sugar dehydrogenase [Cellulosimicrobium cellulans]KON72419.1 hypothetical protein M768_15730 [Cellulosimicrobium cellulans F16]